MKNLKRLLKKAKKVHSELRKMANDSFSKYYCQVELIDAYRKSKLVIESLEQLIENNNKKNKSHGKKL